MTSIGKCQCGGVLVIVGFPPETVCTVDEHHCPNHELGHHFERRDFGSDPMFSFNASCVYCGKDTTLRG